jgi:predicted ATPase
MTQTEQRWFLAEALRVRGEILLRSQHADIDAAEVAFKQAIVVARGQSTKRFEFRAAMRLARLSTDRGKCVEHRGLLGILGDGLADGSELDGFSDMEVFTR